jgi:[acyl-carrier-protein] S-malonyltransferase
LRGGSAEIDTVKTAFVFSGQGAQYPGMGRELYDNFTQCRRVFEEACDTLSMDVRKLCFDESEAARLGNTEFCQPAILTVSVACWSLMREIHEEAAFCAGLSLGEYSALTASGALTFADGLRILRKRGRFMADAADVNPGVMSAVLGLEADTVEELCAEVAGYVAAANFNAPGQVVISGREPAVREAERLAMLRGASRTLRLPVSGAFHSELMRPAAKRLGPELDAIRFRRVGTPVVSNVDAVEYGSEDEIPAKLVRQLVSPVLWERSVRRMIERGAEAFVELGPGRTLSSFTRKTDKMVDTLNIEDVKSYKRVVEFYGSMPRRAV